MDTFQYKKKTLYDISPSTSLSEYTFPPPLLNQRISSDTTLAASDSGCRSVSSSSSSQEYVLMALDNKRPGKGRVIRWQALWHPKVLCVVGSTLMVVSGVFASVLEKHLSDDLDLASPHLAQIMVMAMTALLLELYIVLIAGSQRFPTNLSPYAVLPMVGWYLLSLLLNHASRHLRSTHGTYQCVQSILPLMVLLILGRQSFSKSFDRISNRCRKPPLKYLVWNLYQYGSHGLQSSQSRHVVFPLGLSTILAIWSSAHPMSPMENSQLLALWNLSSTLLNFAIGMASVLSSALWLTTASHFLLQYPPVGFATVYCLRQFCSICLLCLLVIWPLVQEPILPLGVLQQMASSTDTLLLSLALALLGSISLIVKFCLLQSVNVMDGPLGVSIILQTKTLVCLAIGWWIYGFGYGVIQTFGFYLSIVCILIWIIFKLS